MIKVYHINDVALPRDEKLSVTFGYVDSVDHARRVGAFFRKPGYYVHVATVDCTNLDTAYRLTNNIDSSWSLDPHSTVTVTEPFHVVGGVTYGHRSSMIGDVFEDESGFHVVSNFGFTSIVVEDDDAL